MRVAGERQQNRFDVGRVDYVDVLKQAVDNERWRVMREVLEIVESIRVYNPGKSAYSSEERTATHYRKDLLDKLKEERNGWA